MRYYSTTAGEMTLATAVGAGDTTLVVDTTAGLPVTYPYTLIVDYGEATEEVVDVTNASGVNLTVTRGRDSTSAQSHSLGAKIRHGVTARDFRESRQHEDATSGVHGVTGDVVGDDDVQSLTNKTFQPTADHTALALRARAGNTIPLAIVKDSAGTNVGTITEQAITSLNSTGQTLASFLWGAAAATFKQYFSLQLRSDYNAIVGSVVAGFTGKFLRLMNGATELFSVDGLGVVRSTGEIVTGNVAATGTVTGSNLGTAAWASYTPTFTNITVGNGVVDGKYTQTGKTVTGRVQITMGSTTTFGAGSFLSSLPVSASSSADLSPVGSVYMLDSSAGSPSRTIGVVARTGSGVFFVGNTTGSTVTNLVPWTWASGDILNFTFTYEAA